MSKYFYQNSKPVGYIWKEKEKKLSAGDVFAIGGLCVLGMIAIGYIGYKIRK